MTVEEQRAQARRKDTAIVEAWTPARIKAMADSLPWSRTRLAAILAINRRSLSGLETGQYTPGAALCYRMEMIEAQAASGQFHPEITPAKAELRRRLLLFRAWWYRKPPSKASPVVTVRIQVEWGKGRYERMTLPINLQIRLLKFEGLVDVIKATTKAVRSLVTGFQRLNWTECEAEYWERWRDQTLPEIVKQRAAIPGKMIAARMEKRAGKNK